MHTAQTYAVLVCEFGIALGIFVLHHSFHGTNTQNEQCAQNSIVSNADLKKRCRYSSLVVPGRVEWHHFHPDDIQSVCLFALFLLLQYSMTHVFHLLRIIKQAFAVTSVS